MNPSLNESECSALMSLCVMAAYADGDKGEHERGELKRIVEGLDASGLNPVLIYHEALRQPPPIAETAARLKSPAARTMAYEMAVCVCDADDVLNERERAFLEQLRVALGLQEKSTSEFQQQSDAIAATPIPMIRGVEVPEFAQPVQQANQKGGIAPDPEGDAMILNYSILNGALELLPQSLATMAIVPVQMNMVYRLGKRHGYELDRKHLGDFLATVGVGLTSQVVEGYARKLLGSLISKVAGGKVGQLGKSVAGQATSSAFSFASTYALGQVARQYYAGGRKFASIQLKELFTSSLNEAKGLHGRYLPQIQERMKTLNPTQLLSLIRGK